MQRSGAVMAWNVFRFCTALRGLGSVMILLVLGIVGVTYYAVVVTNYGPAVLNAGGLESLSALAALLLFHLLLVMLLWCYFSVVLTDPGSVPPNWKPTVDEERGEETPLNNLEFTNQILSFQQSANLADSGSPRTRYCRKCNHLKPPRCHHCSVCGRCILKMDHHCVWVVNCVGALNYKFFLLFLRNKVRIGEENPDMEICEASLKIFSTHFSRQLLLPCCCCPILLLCLVMRRYLEHLEHLRLLFSHLAYEKKTTPKWKYNLGRKKNFEQVFGADRRYWFIPAYSEEDLKKTPALQGLDYPTKADFSAQEF
ncbi:probable protein S-acyltransferase 14 isoform X1 [Elaeis guineensis]|uniref:probable protein S-acyltransferase 14 isoform X1 n=1 Tax=Elaeis guineensis var. tenera TaxID=51953 RepID=UPI003C6CC579